MRKLAFLLFILIGVLAACDSEATAMTTVHFETFEGAAIDSVEVALGDTITLPEPTLEGAHFDGWYVDQALTEPFEPGFLEGDTLTLYAKWLDVLTVTYFVEGDVHAVYEVIEGETAPMPDEPTREDAIFEGWYWDETFAEAAEIPFTVSEDVTLFAAFSPDVGELVIRYEDAEGALITNQMYTEGETLIFPEPPEKTGHLFVGWLHAGDLIDEGIALNTSKTLTAHFEVLSYTVTFETGDADPIEPLSVSYGTDLDLPVSTLEGMQFAGWYRDADFAEPFTATTMPAEDVTLYARFVSEDAEMDLLTVIMTRPETAQLENVTVLYTTTLAMEDVTLTILEDDTAAIYAIGLEGVSVGDVISFDGTFIYQDDTIPTLVHADNLIIETTTEVTLDVAPIDLEGLGDLDGFDPLNVGTFYTIEAPLILEEGVTAIDPDTMAFYPIMNLDMTHPDFSALEHYYVQFGFTLFPIDEAFTALLYVEDAQAMTSVVLNTEEKLDIIEQIVTAVIEGETYEAGMGLYFPEEDPIFGSAMTVEAIGDNASLYDHENDVFHPVDEETAIDFTATLTLDGITRTVNATAIVVPEAVHLISDGHTLEMGVLDVLIVHVSGRSVIAQDESGLIALDNLTDQTLTVGERYRLAVGFIQRGPLVSGYVYEVRLDLGSEVVDLDAVPFTFADLEALQASPHTGKYIEISGILFDNIDVSVPTPYVLRHDDALIYLVSNDPHVMAKLQDHNLEQLTLTGYLIEYTTLSQEPGYVFYFPYGADDITFSEPDDADLLTILESLIEPDDTLLRPHETVNLFTEVAGFDVAYEPSSGDLEAIEFVQDERLAQLTFNEAGTVYLNVTVTDGDLTHTFTLTLVAEDYDLNSIAYAQSLPEGTPVTLHVEVQATHTDFHLVLSDGSGAIMLNANTVTEWLMPGDTLIVSGALETIQGVDWLVDATIESLDVPLDITGVEPDVWTIDDLLLLDTPLEGMQYIEVTGVLSTRAHIDGLALFSDDDTYIELGIDFERESQFWATYYGNEITIRGYFLTDTHGQNTIALAERVETEFVGTISDLYDLEETTRVRVTALGVVFMFDAMYLMDETGIIAIRGIAGAWAQNRVGQMWEFYGDVIVENGRRYIDISTFDFITADDLVDDDLTTVVQSIAFIDFVQLDFLSSDAPYQTAYQLTGTLIRDDDTYYLIEGDFQIEVAFEVSDLNASDYVDETVTLQFIVLSSFEAIEIVAYPLALSLEDTN